MKKSFLILLAATVLCATPAFAQTSVTRDADGHATIVIHNTDPEAYQARREMAQKALERREQRQERERERAHEIKMEKLKARNERRAERERAARELAQNPPEYNRRERPAFFNGGYPTVTGVTFAPVGFPGWGFGGFAGPGFVGNPGFCGPRRGGFHGGFRGGYHGGFRGGYRGGFRGRGGCR